MTKVEAMLKEQMETDVFHNVNTDDFGFEELLERYQDIIAEKEADAAAGRIDLRTDDNYKRAKEWMHKNTRLVYDFGTGHSKQDITKAEAEGIINDETNPNIALKALTK